MNTQQWTLVVGSVALTALLYFGFSTKPPKQRLIEKSRAVSFEDGDIALIVRDAKAVLPEDVRSYIGGQENIASRAPDDSSKVDALISLSGAWYEQGQYDLAGHYAEKIADIDGAAESWAIAGTTYGAGLNAEDVPEAMRKRCASGAVRSFENAISIDPANPEHRLNLALCYAEEPPPDNPMKGIQMLLGMNKSDPGNVSVMYHLARLGMRTGQFEKARERLETALELEPGQRRLHCLMAEVLEKMGQSREAEVYSERCKMRE